MSNKEQLELLIKAQGDVVRRLKQAKENKDKVRRMMVTVLHHASVLECGNGESRELFVPFLIYVLGVGKEHNFWVSECCHLVSVSCK